MSGLLGMPLGNKGSARARYGRAMMLYVQGVIDMAQLEAYRVASAHDRLHPALFLKDRGLAVPVYFDGQDDLENER